MRLAIAGAGIVGAAIAYELSLVPGWELTLYEAQSAPATGSSGAALGVMMAIISQKTKGRAWQLRRQSIDRYDGLIRNLETQTGQRIPYNQQGLVRLCFAEDDPERWRSLQAHRQSQGYTLELWDRKALRLHCPQITDPRVQGAVYSPSDRQVDPIALTQALLAAAEQNGVEICYGHKLAYQLDLPGFAVNAQAINADALILTAGLGTTALTPELDIRPVLGQAMRLKLPKTLGDRKFQPVIAGHDVLLVPLNDGRYWVGATVEFPDLAGQVVAQAQARDELWQEAIALCPDLANAQIEAEWSGLRPRPWGQGAPVVQVIAGDRPTLAVTGHYRNGVLLAPSTAHLAKEWLQTVQP